LRIPSLDGLRAISIALVLIGHAYIGRAIAGTWVWRFIGRADLGVAIFFVISGFLITSLLLREEEKTGRTSLRDFYLRRLFRIVPPFYTYLLVVLMAWHLGWLTSNRGAWLASLFFVRDYAHVSWDWSTGHSWSLSIEEQFYLLWPFALVVFGRNKGVKLAVAIVVATPLVRTICHGIWGHNGPHEFFTFHFRADALMTGSLLALLQSRPLFQALWRKVESVGIALGCSVFLVLVSPALALRFLGWYYVPLGMSLDNFAIAYLMFYVIRNPEGLLGRVLNWRPIVHVGVLSYSLYLWQELFLSPTTQHILLSLIAALVCAELSWYLVETPSRWMRDRVMTSRRWRSFEAPPLSAVAHE
jgi:peptidoglycan/LPS O-acetylase OafA/YrhL